MQGLERIKKLVNLGDLVTACDYGSFPHANTTTKFRGAHCSANETQCVVNPAAGHWHCFSCGQSGDAIKWVLHAKFEGDYARIREAIQWICDYYGVDFQDTLLDSAQFKTYDTLTQLAWKWHRALVQNEKAYTWVQTQYGLSPQTIEQLAIGWCESIKDEDIEESALLSAGLIKENRYPLLTQRITIPHFVSGQVVWISGRQIEGAGPKYQTLAQTAQVQPVLYNYDNAYTYPDPNEPLIICEGLMDAARAYQEGFRVVATAGTQVYNPLIKQQFDALNTRCRDYKYIIYDAEKSGRGYSGAKGLAQNLLRLGIDPFIVDMPRPEGVDKLDLCDYLNANSRDKVTELCAKACEEQKTLPNILLDDVGFGADGSRISGVLASVVGLAEYQAEKYLKKLADKAAVPMKNLHSMFKDERKKAQKVSTVIAEDFERVPYYAQDYEYLPDIDVWRHHKCVYVPVTRTVEDGDATRTETVEPPVIMQVDITKTGYTIAKQQYEYDLTTFPFRRNLPPKEGLSKVDCNRWSVDRKSPYSLPNFLETPNMVSSTERVFQQCLEYFQRFVWMPDPRELYIPALFCMWTYMYMGFSATPYIHLYGEKGTGKSTIAELMTELCFNVMATSSLSAAVLFRMTHGGRCTLYIDEAERLRNPRADSADGEIIQIANGGYTAGSSAYVYRAEYNENAWEPAVFYTYCPKIFAGTTHIKDTLESRCITMNTVMPPPTASIENLTAQVAYESKGLQLLRDQLFVWSVTNFREVRGAYDDLEFAPEVRFDRFRQVWAPLLAIAKAVGVKGFYEEMQDLAMSKRAARIATTLERDFGARFLVTLYEIYRNNPEDAGVYLHNDKYVIDTAVAVRSVRTRLNEEQVWEKMTDVCNAGFLLGKLRSITAIGQSAKRTTISRQGGKVNVYPYSPEALEAFVLEKGAALDSADSNTETA